MRTSKSGKKLIDLVKSGKLSPKDTNKEGHTALMHAVDCELPLSFIKELVKLGCNVNQ